MRMCAKPRLTNPSQVRRASRSKQRHSRLDRHEQGRNFERLKNDPYHVFSIGLGVRENVCEQDRKISGATPNSGCELCVVNRGTVRHNGRRVSPRK